MQQIGNANAASLDAARRLRDAIASDWTRLQAENPTNPLYKPEVIETAAIRYRIGTARFAFEYVLQ